MSRKSILLFILLLSVAGLAQRTSISPSEAETLNKLEGEQPALASQPAAESQKSKTSDAVPQKPRDKNEADPMLGTITSSALNQRVAPATALSNDELLARGKTIYVVSHSFFVKREQLERGLLNRKELIDWGFHVVQDAKNADFILSVKRAPFQNNFPFVLTDRASGIVLMGGTVNSLFGTVPGKIAGRLADRFKEVYKAQKNSN